MYYYILNPSVLSPCRECGANKTVKKHIYSLVFLVGYAGHGIVRHHQEVYVVVALFFRFPQHYVLPQKAKKSPLKRLR